MKRLSSILIIIAGVFWGTMGLFVRAFSSMGFTTLQIVAIRMTMGGILLLFLLLMMGKRKYLLVKWRDFPLLFSIGLFSLAAMSILYFTTIELTTMSVAAILLYLSPVVVMVLSAILFKDRLTKVKLISLFLAVLGCFLVSGVGGATNVGLVGILTGIGSAVAYGLYSILGNIALKKYHPYTITFWAFVSAGITFLIVSQPDSLLSTAISYPDHGKMFLYVIGIGGVTAVIPYVLYTIGLKRTKPSNAAIFACSEPVAATLMGVAVYQEVPGIYSCCGMVLVLCAIVLLSVGMKTRK